MLWTWIRMTIRKLRRLLIQCFCQSIFIFILKKIIKGLIFEFWNRFWYSYPAVFIFCFLPNTLARWLYFENPNKPPPPYQFTLFASSVYGLSGLFNLILFLFTRPKVVVGCPAYPTKEGAVSPIHFRHDSRKRLDYDYGSLSTDIENPSRHGSPTYEIQSPSRTMHRIRSSYDMQGISNLPSSPTRNVNSSYRWAPSSDVLDIGHG